MNKYTIGIILVLVPYFVNLCLKIDRDAAIKRMHAVLEHRSRKYWSEAKCRFIKISIQLCREQLVVAQWRNQLVAVDFSFSTDLDWDILIAEQGPYLHFLYSKFMKMEFKKQITPEFQVQFMDYKKIELANNWLKTQISQVDTIVKNQLHPVIYIPSSFKWSAKEQYYNQFRFYAQANGLFVPSFYKWLGYLRVPWQEKNLERILEISQQEMEIGFIYQLPTVLKEIYAWGDLNNHIVTPDRKWHVRAKEISKPSGLQFAGPLDMSGFTKLRIRLHNYGNPFPLTLMAAEAGSLPCEDKYIPEEHDIWTMTRKVSRGQQTIVFDLKNLQDVNVAGDGLILANPIAKECSIRRLSFSWDYPIKNLNFKIEELRWEN